MFIFAEEVKDDSRKHTQHIARLNLDVRFMKYANALFVNVKDYIAFLEVDHADVIEKYKSLIPGTWNCEYEKIWMNVDLYLQIQKNLNPNRETN